MVAPECAPAAKAGGLGDVVSGLSREPELRGNHDGITSHFQHLKNQLNDNPDCHLEIGYREDLAHLMYAGSDVLIVPSMFEPCGLAPLNFAPVPCLITGQWRGVT
jgi:glycogen synthase